MAIDVPPAIFDLMTRSNTWITDDDAWKAIATGFPTAHAAYAQQIRDAVVKRKADGLRFILLFAVREEKVQLLSL